uniref:Uncharacterized protein n=1 Tax=Sphaerodactylus townsendi TaxID=933632 RepID=A0ACB8E9I3_9SAUR
MRLGLQYEALHALQEKAAALGSPEKRWASVQASWPKSSPKSGKWSKDEATSLSLSLHSGSLEMPLLAALTGGPFHLPTGPQGRGPPGIVLSKSFTAGITKMLVFFRLYGRVPVVFSSDVSPAFVAGFAVADEKSGENTTGTRPYNPKNPQQSTRNCPSESKG